MKQKTLLLLLVAIGCGLAAAFLVSNLKAGRGADTEKVWGARGEIGVGVEIKPEMVEKMFEPKDFLKGTAPMGSFNVENPADLSTMLGKKITLPMKPGDILTKKHLEDISLGSQLAPGCRAVSVPVQMASAAAGFILPGARVDLITTYNRDSQTVAAVFLQNVRVLAINTATDRPPESSSMANPTTATLEVKPEQAAKIDLAMRLGGQIKLILRGLGDNKELDPKKVEVTSITGTGKDGSGETVQEKILVAKRDISKDEEVKNLEELFEAKDAPEGFFDNAIFVKSFDDGELKTAKTFTAGLKRGTPVTRSLLTGEKPVVVEPTKVAAAPPRHKMTIYNGPKREVFEPDMPAAPSEASPGAAPKSPGGSEGK